jgi:allophanate hydrolase subunit 2
LGGFKGRALVAGDRLTLGDPAPRGPFASPVDPSMIPGYRRGEPFRVTQGPQADWFSPDVTTAFHDAVWRVAEACDRMGIRLHGPELRIADPRELLTEGVCLGAIQIPSGGRPIVLSVEHQTTGGYPKIANVIAADLARLGTLRPRDTIRLAPVDLSEARALFREQQDALDALFV